jgi:hypothetical protein
MIQLYAVKLTCLGWVEETEVVWVKIVVGGVVEGGGLILVGEERGEWN